LVASTLHVIVTITLAGTATLFDLDRTFGSGALPSRTARKTLWWWGFIIINAGFATAVWFALRNLSPFLNWNPWLYSVAIGIGYLGLVRLKFATVTLRNQEVPVGIETFYEAARQFVYTRINQAVKAERIARTQLLIAGHDLKSLGRSVRLDIQLDSLLPAPEKAVRLAWLLQVLQDKKADEDQKKLILAMYLASGMRE
jgi:hypothetical protein